jgi:hypothetical protein
MAQAGLPDESRIAPALEAVIPTVRPLLDAPPGER